MTVVEQSEWEREETEIINESKIARSVSLSELWDMWKDFSRRPGKHIITWLLQCWDARANGLERDGKQDKDLGSLPKEKAIDKVVGNGVQVLRL